MIATEPKSLGHERLRVRASLGVGRRGVACLRSTGKMDLWRVDFVVLVIAVVSRSGYVLGHTCYATVSSPCQCQFVSEGKSINISYFDEHPYVCRATRD